jgi:glyoxylase-like metal-dependent hydrolase (beta-lactamase superfamily II)
MMPTQTRFPRAALTGTIAAAIVIAVAGATRGAPQQTATGAAGQLAAAQAPPPLLVKLRDDVYVIQNVNHVVAEIGQNGGNATVLVSPDGVVLIDTKNERMHDDLVAKVRSLTDRPIRYAVLTHNHADHSGGASRLQADGVTIVASAATRENMIRANQPGAPQIVYSGSSQIVLGGKELQLRELRGHTRGDTVVLIPSARIVVAGDLVATPDTIPAIVNYGDGGSWTDLGRALDEVGKLDFDTLIGGHGPALTKAEFLKYRERIGAILERFRGLNRERRSADDITQVLLKEFNWGTGPAAGNIAGMLQELR